MLTFLCRDRPVSVLSPSLPVLSNAVTLASPCIPRIQSSFSVPERSLIYDRFKVFLNSLFVRSKERDVTVTDMKQKR